VSVQSDLQAQFVNSNDACCPSWHLLQVKWCKVPLQLFGFHLQIIILLILCCCSWRELYVWTAGALTLIFDLGFTSDTPLDWYQSTSQHRQQWMDLNMKMSPVLTFMNCFIIKKSQVWSTMYCFNLATFHVADRWEMFSIYCKGEMLTLHYRSR